MVLTCTLSPQTLTALKNFIVTLQTFLYILYICIYHCRTLNKSSQKEEHILFKFVSPTVSSTGFICWWAVYSCCNQLNSVLKGMGIFYLIWAIIRWIIEFHGRIFLFFMERQKKKCFQKIYYTTGVKSATGQKSWGSCGITERSLD